MPRRFLALLCIRRRCPCAECRQTRSSVTDENPKLLNLQHCRRTEPILATRTPPVPPAEAALTAQVAASVRAAPLGSRQVVPSAESSRHRASGTTGLDGDADHPPQTHAQTVAQFAPDGNPYAAITAQYQAQLPGLAALLQHPGVMVLRAERGQVLLQAEHLSRGLFLCLDGELAMASACGCTETVDTQAGFFLFPTLTELDVPAGRTATPRRSALTVFVPRTLVLLGDEVRDLLAGLLVREVSLRAHHESAGAHP